MRKYLKISLLIILAIVFVACDKIPQEIITQVTDAIKEPTQSTDKELADVTAGIGNDVMEVEFIDVGQADAILVTTGQERMLIDCGDNKTEKELVAYLQSKAITKIDYLIGTHPHADHIGGMEKVIDAFEIGKIYMPKVTHTTKTFESVLKSAKAKEYKISTGKVGEQFTMGEDVKVEMLSPTREKYEELNDYSIVIKLSNGEDDFLLMGDAEKLVEEDIMALKTELSAEVLKLGHHGSSSSSSEAFIKEVTPEVAIISSGQDNSYGHPHKETMQTLEKYNIMAYDTKNKGTITAKSTGKGITFTTEK